MPDHPEIYRSQAEQYEALVSREDYQCNIFPALKKITPLENTTVVELGAGTGRLTCQLAPVVKSIHAFDISAHMLEVAKEKLMKTNLQNWQVAVSDHRHVTIEDGTADIIISGWSVCYVVVNNPQTWQTELQNTLDEIHRILRPGGVIILIETLGTGFESPEPPANLLAYYQFLETHGFQRDWIRTDYQFENRLEAETLTRFFFGEKMVEKIWMNTPNPILPECTGIWWKKQDV